MDDGSRDPIDCYTRILPPIRQGQRHCLVKAGRTVGEAVLRRILGADAVADQNHFTPFQHPAGGVEGRDRAHVDRPAYHLAGHLLRARFEEIPHLFRLHLPSVSTRLGRCPAARGRESQDDNPIFFDPQFGPFHTDEEGGGEVALEALAGVENVNIGGVHLRHPNRPPPLPDRLPVFRDEVTGVDSDHPRPAVHQHIHFHLQMGHPRGLFHIPAHVVAVGQPQWVDLFDHPVVILLNRIPASHTGQDNFAAPAPAALEIGADLADADAIVGLGHFPVDPDGSPLAGDAQIAEAGLVKTVVNDAAHPIHQAHSQPLSPLGRGMAARCVDKCDILIRHAQAVEIIEQFVAQAIPLAQHLICETVSGHHHHPIARSQAFGYRRTIDGIFQRSLNRQPGISHRREVGHADFGRYIWLGNTENAFAAVPVHRKGFERGRRGSHLRAFQKTDAKPNEGAQRDCVLFVRLRVARWSIHLPKRNYFAKYALTISIINPTSNPASLRGVRQAVPSVTQLWK